MLLGGNKIREEIQGTLRGLNIADITNKVIITPLLNPTKQVASNSCAVDLRLSTQFTVHKKSRVPSFDPLERDYEYYKENLIDSYYVDLGNDFVLHPNQFILGLTLEWVHLPLNYACYVIGRSSWGRQGLIIATATGVHPGFKGNLVLELFNAGEIPIHLYPGVRIAQLFIHSVDQGSSTIPEPDGSRAVGQTRPDAYSPLGEDEKDILAELKREHD